MEQTQTEYIAIDNKWMFREATLVLGYYHHNNEWTPGRNLAIPKDTLIRSGSRFKIIASKAREKAWFMANTVAPADAQLHFNLEDIFEPAVADLLRLNAINTLEDVATELDAIIPGSEMASESKKPTTIPLRVLLGQVANKDEETINAWISGAVNLCKIPVPPSEGE